MFCMQKSFSNGKKLNQYADSVLEGNCSASKNKTTILIIWKGLLQMDKKRETIEQENISKMQITNSRERYTNGQCMSLNPQFHQWFGEAQIKVAMKFLMPMKLISKPLLLYPGRGLKFTFTSC